MCSWRWQWLSSGSIEVGLDETFLLLYVFSRWCSLFGLDQITSASANFETVLSLLSSFFVPEDENLLLSWIGKTLGNQKLRSNMGQWRVDWQRLVQKGEDGDALL
jgi:hypothetical protein